MNDSELYEDVNSKMDFNLEENDNNSINENNENIDNKIINDSEPVVTKLNISQNPENLIETKELNNSKELEPIYVLSLELETGKTEQLKIFSDTDAGDTAYQFCSKNNLDFDTLNMLKQKIEFLIKNYNSNLSNGLSNNKNDENIVIDNLNGDQNKLINYNSNVKKLNEDIICNDKYLKIQNDFYENFDFNNINIIDYDNIEKENYRNNKNFDMLLTNENKELKQKFSCSKTPKKKSIISMKKIKIKNCSPSDKLLNKIFNHKKLTPNKVQYQFPISLTTTESAIKNKNKKGNYVQNGLSSNKINIEHPILFNNKIITNYGQYLYEKSLIFEKQKKSKISELERIISSNEERACSFQPKTNSINNKNNNYLNIKSKYKYIKNKQEIKNDQNYSFQPKINTNYQTNLNFEQRVNFFTNLYKKRNKELKYYFANDKKDEYGNELFKPKLISKTNYLNTNINNGNNTTQIDAFKKNYLYYKKYSLDKKELSKKYNENISYNMTNYSTNNTINNIKEGKMKSKQILNNICVKVFTELYNELDNDKDNLITPININTSTLSKEVFKIIEPVITELKEDNQTLTCCEFIKVMFKLFEDTDYIDKKILIGTYNNKYKNNSCLLSKSKSNSYFDISKKKLSNSFSMKAKSIINNNQIKNINKSSSKDWMAQCHDKKIRAKMYTYLSNNKKYDNNCMEDNSNKIHNKMKKSVCCRKQKNENINIFSRYTFNNYMNQIRK